jgi:hypothetical protein
MRLRRYKKCFLILLSVPVTLGLIHLLGYTPLLYGMDPNVKRPHIRFEDAMEAGKIDPRKPRIMVTWYGRMGNHMFQYSCLIGVAARNNMTPIIPFYIDILDVFDLPTPQGNKDLLRNPIRYPDKRPGEYDNKTEHLDPTRDAFLDGYHQSWKYHWHVRDELIDKHFVFHKPILNTALNYIAQVRKVSVWVCVLKM